MDAEVFRLSAQMAEVVLRNTAATISDKVTAAKARRKDQETIAELEEIITNLISDKNEIALIGQAYEQELIGQRISLADVEYIMSNLIPIFKRLAEATPSQNEQARDETKRTIEAVEAILSVQTVTILQLLGFNFKRAIGEPLTELVASLVASRTPSDHGRMSRLQELGIERELAYVRLAQDPAAVERLSSMFSQ